MAVSAGIDLDGAHPRGKDLIRVDSHRHGIAFDYSNLHFTLQPANGFQYQAGLARPWGGHQVNGEDTGLIEHRSILGCQLIVRV